jgi:hypothetical protein
MFVDSAVEGTVFCSHGPVVVDQTEPHAIYHIVETLRIAPEPSPMRDDDDFEDDPEGDPPAGEVLHSGIRRESEIEPADYALPPGVPALESDPGLACEAEHGGDAPLIPHRYTRRRILACAAGGLLVGSAAFLGGSLYSRRADDSRSPRGREGPRLSQEDLELIEVARGWVRKPIDVLVGSAASFLWVFHHVEPDDRLRHGLRRLCDYCLLHRDEKGCKLAVRILGTFQSVPVPSGFEQDLNSLSDLVWRWQVTQETKRR